MRCIVTLLFGLSLLTAAGLCAAQDSDDDEARDQFQRGKELYAEGKFVEAATAFQRAYTLKPSYKILYNIGQAENENGEYVRAFEAYRKYLDEGGDEVDAPRRGEVEKEIKRLDSLIGSVVVEGAPDGAVLLVDDRRMAEAPFDEPVRVKLGDRKIVVKDGGVELFSEVVRIAGGARKVVQVTQKAGPHTTPGGHPDLGEPVTQLDHTPSEGTGHNLKVAGIVTMAVGGALAVGAGVTGGIAVSKKGSIEDDCQDGNCPADKKSDLDGARAVAMTSTVLTIAAGAVIATGLVLTIVGVKKEKESAVNLSAAAGADGGMLMLGGRF